MNEIMSIAEKVGIPFAIVVAVGAGLWQILRWIAPRVDKVVDRHVHLIDTLSDHITRHTDALDLIQKQVTTTHSTVAEIAESMRRGGSES